ncbi:hypothetical protein [Streptosporangium sp. KLBMP 9127]|nr:hypothetical protein [Streptosporangium sp. KLBMP 9127]
MSRTIARLVTVLMVLAAVAAPGTAQARGNWAVTYLDPVPARFSAGTAYTFGFWVLQHGTHPFWGEDIGEVALRFTGDTGEVLTFPGVELKEAAHYAAAVSLPAGSWRMTGVQGMFQPHEVGLLTVPGGLKVNPLPQDLPTMEPPEGGKEYWGAIRPPGFPAGDGETQPVGPAGDGGTQPAGTPEPAPASGAAGNTITATVAGPATPWWRSPYTVAALVLLLAGTAGAVGVVRARRR